VKYQIPEFDNDYDKDARQNFLESRSIMD